jgi:hypothetical protein
MVIRAAVHRRARPGDPPFTRVPNAALLPLAARPA